MHFVGLDLAWGEKNQTGVAVVDSDGRLLHVGAAHDDDSIATAVAPFTKDDCLVAIDAPLIVKNATGHRPAETQFNRDFQRFEAGARPAFTDRPEFKHPRAARIAERLGLDMDPSSSSSRRAIEVYPHPATVVLFELEKTLKYKRGPFADRHRELLRLMTLIEGLDEAIIGLKAGESKVFTTTLAAGPHAGQEAEVTVTVKSVKERELPEADDEFAQLASEFDTIDELKESLVEQVKRVKRIQQAEQIRDKALEALLADVEVPLPEAIVQAQIDDTLHNAIHGLDHDEDKFNESLTEQGSSREEFDTNTRNEAEKAVKTQLLMDAVADKLDIQVGQADLTERLVLMSRQYGIEPQQLLQVLQQNNQLPAMFADVRRGLTIAAVVQGATVTDSDGNAVDTAEFFGPAGGEETADAEAAEDLAVEAPAADAAESEAAADEDAAAEKAEKKDKKKAKKKSDKKSDDSSE